MEINFSSSDLYDPSVLFRQLSDADQNCFDDVVRIWGGLQK